MDKFTIKKSKTNRKFVFITTTLSLGLFFGGTVFNICQGKFNNKLNAAEQKDGQVAPLTPLPAGFKEAMEHSFQQGTEWPDRVILNNTSMKVEYNFIFSIDIINIFSLYRIYQIYWDIHFRIS